MKYLFLFMIVFASSLLAQPVDADKRFEEEMRERMKRDREMIERFMNDDMFKKFDQMFEKMVQDLDQGKFEGLQKFFDPNNFDQFLNNSGLGDKLNLGDGKWVENPTERILVLKIARKKEEPLKIDIKDGKVTVSGEVTTKEERFDLRGAKTMVETLRKINQSYDIPNDVDAKKPKFEHQGESILVRFKKY